MPDDPAAALRALRACREAMIRTVSMTVEPMCPVDKAAYGVTQAIDALTGLLTGDREYFWDRGTTGSASRSRVEAAHEAGAEPWPDPLTRW